MWCRNTGNTWLLLNVSGHVDCILFMTSCRCFSMRFASGLASGCFFLRDERYKHIVVVKMLSNHNTMLLKTTVLIETEKHSRKYS